MKYNDNGTIREIPVKASDTLPIGSIVEFDGDTIPSGWEEVEDNGIAYSDEEQVIGTWYGKPLYSRGIKTIVPECTTDGTGNTLKINIPNIDEFFLDSMTISTITYDQNFQLPINQNNAYSSGVNKGIRINLYANEIEISNYYTSNNGFGLSIKISYTKTTD